MKLSVLIPVFNEEKNLPAIHAALDSLSRRRETLTIEGATQELDMTEYDWEFMFVNDGSTDASLNILLDLRSRDQRVNVVNFSRNFGKETALLAGMDFCDGDAVIIMDADGQDPVEVIPEMIWWWRQGYDDVYGERISRGKESFMRKTLSLSFYKILQKFSKIDILSNSGDFRLLSRRAVNAVTQLRESQRYTKGLYCWVGFNKKAVRFDRSDRTRGKSSFNYSRLFNLALDGITSYTTSPLRMASLLGFFVSALTLIYLIFVLCKYLIYGEAVRGYPTLVSLILFLGGVQLLSLGIIGEYIGRIFTEVKQRPPYIVESFNDRSPAEKISCRDAGRNKED